MYMLRCSRFLVKWKTRWSSSGVNCQCLVSCWWRKTHQLDRPGLHSVSRYCDRLSCISYTATFRLVPFVSCRWRLYSYVKWRVSRTSIMNDPCWCTLKTRPTTAVLMAIYVCASAVYRQPSGRGWRWIVP